MLYMLIFFTDDNKNNSYCC